MKKPSLKQLAKRTGQLQHTLFKLQEKADLLKIDINLTKDIPMGSSNRIKTIVELLGTSQGLALDEEEELWKLQEFEKDKK